MGGDGLSSVSDVQEVLNGGRALADKGAGFFASNPVLPSLPATVRAMLTRGWPGPAGVPVPTTLLAGGQSQTVQITAAPTGIPASVAANTTANVALTGITGLLATDILVGVQKAASQAGLITLPADLALGGVTGAGAATVRYANDTVGAIVPTAAESYVFTVLRNAGAIATVTLSAPNAGTAVAGSALRALVTPFGGPSAVYVPGIVTVGGAPPSTTASQFGVSGRWTEEDASYFYIDFISDSPKFEVVVVGSSQKWRGLENGQLYTTQASASLTNGNNYRILVDHGGVRAMRSYRFEFAGSSAKIQGIQCLATDTVLPGPRRGMRVIVVGDSYTDGTGATDTTTAWPQTLSWLTGWDCWALGEGGTGYLSPNVGQGLTKAAGHLSDVTTNAPDLVLWALGINDWNNFTAAAIGAEAAADFATVKSALPNVPQIVLGPFGTPSNFGNATWAAARDAIKASAVAAGLPFADPMGQGVPPASGSYLTGNGHVGAENGTGNADFLVWTDFSHPSQAGHDALARAVASSIAAALAG